MGALLQVIAIVAFLVVLILLPEVTWHLLRLRRLRSGVDIGTMPWSLGYWYGLRLKGAVVGLAFALVAGVIALGASNPTLGGYLIFGIGLIAAVILITAYYVWRARTIANNWWRRAHAKNDAARND